MVSQTIRKATVYAKDLPLVGPSNSYLVRYRIISEDRNLASTWSVPVEVIGNPITIVNGDIDISLSKASASITWDDENNRPQYDVFVRFGNNSASYDTDSQYWGNWIYHGTSPIHNYRLLIPATVASSTDPETTLDSKKIEVRIRVACTSKVLTGNVAADQLRVYSGISDI